MGISSALVPDPLLHARGWGQYCTGHHEVNGPCNPVRWKCSRERVGPGTVRIWASLAPWSPAPPFAHGELDNPLMGFMSRLVSVARAL
jgi:hypothetical protein